MEIHVETFGFTHADAKLKAIREELNGNRGNLYEDVSKIMEQSIDQNFNQGGRGPKWKRRKYEYPHPILDKTGEMRDTAADSARRGWSHSIREHALKIYSTFYAGFHQYGTTRLPVRKFVKFLESEKKQVLTTMKKAFKG